MGVTALQEQSTGLGGVVGEYRGATTALRFSDPQAEFAALRAGCGVYDLGYRARFSLTGGDRVRWLNGMVTNNIRDLEAGHGAYAFLLNPQGHILGDLYAYHQGDSIVVDTDRSQVEKVLATFDHYIIMDDVEVKNLSESVTTLGISGPRSGEVLAAAGIVIPETKPLQIVDVKCTCDCEYLQCTVVRGDDPAVESYELWMARGEVKKTWDTLLAHKATPIGSEALEIHRIVNGIPLFGVDIRERDLPQETEQAQALNFNKGCYIGQEIVERIRSRGAVHRKFSGFVADAGQPIESGTKIVVGEKEVGEVTSVASLRTPNPEKTLVLGYIRRELATPGREVMIGGVKATIVALPVPDSILEAQAAPVARPA
jgi:folate-binding protein YgfZ